MRHLQITICLITIWLWTISLPVSAQDVIPVGQGSYASIPPAHEGDGPTKMLNWPVYKTKDVTGPLPTNDWWTDLLVSQYSGALWSYPFKVETNDKGLLVFLPTRFNETGTDLVNEYPLQISSENFHPKDTRLKAHSDWLVTFHMAESDERYIDVTLVRGMPYVWIECHNVTPSIQTQADTNAFNESTHQLGITCANRSYGLHVLPGDTLTKQSGNRIDTRFVKDNGVLVISALPKESDFGLLADHAFAIPRKTTLTWDYDSTLAQVTTQWQIQTQSLDGKQTQAIQGWLPHHLRENHTSIRGNNLSYLTPRGKLNCSTGNSFTITWPMAGLIPFYPSPQKNNIEHDYIPSRMNDYLARYATKAEYGADTYWGGKDLVRMAKYMHYARQLDHPAYPTLKANLLKALTDWLTYDPGEKERYFAAYPNWGALIGFNESYWSYQFTDNHFHAGYFTLSAALLGMVDQSFLKDYGPLVRKIARHYANWEHDAKDYPFLRTFDPFAGHSYAGGFSSATGNNQESTSEAVQSWAGLYLLGVMLDDKKMTATGAMGYAMETAATMEYWFDVHHENWSPNYKHPVVGILFNGGQAYATFFSGDPAWIHGIQWLPASPYLDYLVKDQTFAKTNFDQMIADRKTRENKEGISSMGTALGNVILSHAAQFNPDWVAAQMDELFSANDPIATDNYTAGITYYQTHSKRKLGQRVTTHHIAAPISAVYHNAKTDQWSYVAYNNKPYPRVVSVNEGDHQLGSMLLMPNQLTVANNLSETHQPDGIIAFSPGDKSSNVPVNTKALYVVFTKRVDISSFSSIKLDNQVLAVTWPAPNTAGILLEKPLTHQKMYTVELPEGVRLEDGQVLSQTKWSFTTQPYPALKLVDSSPKNASERVPLSLDTIELHFNQPVLTDTAGTLELQSKTAIALTVGKNQQANTLQLKLAQGLVSDQTYVLTLPATFASENNQTLGKPLVLRFVTSPPSMPPNVYTESFAGGGFSHDDSITVEMLSTENPSGGKHSIKLTGTQGEGMLYLFAGTSDHGEGRKPIDLSDYDAIAFDLCGSAKEVWIKIGHPVFDKDAFGLHRLDDIGLLYKTYTLKLPSPKDQINTVLAVGVQADTEVFIDNIRFIKSDKTAE
ncbi:MAG TPA: hypothetical protein DCM28_08825 [Phycisphaerales bacterium]|nr:hypothetical protein [Phycisphaerales bacterium]